MNDFRHHRSSLRSCCLCLLALVIACLAGGTRAANADAYTERQFAADNLEFQRNSWLETYKRIGHRDPTWDKSALEYLEQFCRYSAYWNVWTPFFPDDVPRYPRLFKLGRQLLDKRCDDPQVAYAHATVLIDMGQPQNAVRFLRDAFAKMKDGKHPAQNVVRIAHRLQSLAKNPPAAEVDAIRAALETNSIRMARGFPPTRAERYCRLLILRDELERQPEIESKVCEALAKADDADPWLRNVLEGERETHLAWSDRGGGFANTVTAQGWKGFGDHLAKARQHLTDAWKLDPSVPGAADAMIAVTMGDGGQGGDTVRTWFDRAIQAKFDDRWALNSILWAYRPRWGGSYQQMFDLGEEFAATGRFDTEVPSWLFRTIQDIAADRDDREGKVWLDPQFYKAAQGVYEGYAKALPPGFGRDWLVSWHAAIAWHAGEFKDARQVLDELGNRVLRDQFTSMTNDPELAVSQVFAYTGQWAQAARDATVEAQKHQDELALSHFRILARATPPGEKASYYYNVYLSQLEFAGKIASGQWIDIQPKDALYLWRPELGRWSIDKDGRLVGVCDGRGLRLRLRPEIGPDYEVVATVENQCPPNRPTCCGLFIDHDGTTWANGLFYSTEVHKVTWYANRAQGQLPIVPGKSNELHLTIWAHQLRATFNGQRVAVPDLVGDVRAPGRTGRLAIAQLFNQTDTTLYVTGLKVRLLREEPH